jgi:hypothetical protein
MRQRLPRESSDYFFGNGLVRGKGLQNAGRALGDDHFPVCDLFPIPSQSKVAQAQCTHFTGTHSGIKREKKEWEKSWRAGFSRCFDEFGSSGAERARPTL